MFGYSFETPPTGDSLHGLSTFYEFTLQKRIALFMTATEPIVKSGHAGVGDTSPGIKFRLAAETRHIPLLAIGYSLKVPTATAALGTGRFDHKLNLYADKNVGVARWTGNFATSWCRQKNGEIKRYYTPALAYLTRFGPHWGGTLQTFWSTSGKGYGGFVAAPFVQVNPSFNFFVGGMRNIGRPSCQYGLIAGFNYMHRPRLKA